jgi:hypothetical protein
VVTRQFVLDNQATGITANTVYQLESPAAIDLGGITEGTVLTGKTSNEILEELLVPTLNPTLTAPSSTFSEDQPANLEVGSTVSTINFTATFDRGSINPDYGTSGFRSGLPNEYNYTGTDLPATVASTSLTDNQSISNYVILEGANQWTASVDYDAGEQPLDSKGGNFGSALPAGTTSIDTVTITGIFPYFFGTFDSMGAAAGASRPTIDNDLVTGGTKVVATSNGTLTVAFNSNSDDYLFFAIPAASTLKTVWFETTLNQGTIGGAVSVGGNLFPDPVAISITTDLWGPESFNVYLSNFQTAVGTLELRNS